MATENGMTLLDHIQELRKRLLRSVLIITLTTALSTLVVDYVVQWL